MNPDETTAVRNAPDYTSLLPDELTQDQALELFGHPKTPNLQDILPQGSILAGGLPQELPADQAQILMDHLSPANGLDLNNLPDELTPEQATTLVNQVAAHNYFGTNHPITRGSGQALAGDRVAVESQVKAMSDKLFGEKEWPALRALIMKESGFNPNAQNPHSSAFGVFQFLDSTRKNYGISRDSSLADQLSAGLKYVKDRYGTPSKALAFHNAKNYY